jgi:SARP family transcriptional regulator, regulator of embCAB operon
MGQIMKASTGSSVSLSIRLIGGLRVERGGTVLSAGMLGSPKARQILEILALQPGIPVSREKLIETLWNGNPPAGARASLESYVSVIRRLIQPGEARTGPLRSARGSYFLDPELVQVDLDRFERLVNGSGSAEPVSAYPMLVQALGMASAPLLSDELIPEWAETARTRHAARVVECQIRAAEMAAALNKADDAVHWAQLSVAAEPLNEKAWTVLVVGLEQAGRPTDALQAYDRCRRLFRRDLGCSPGIGLEVAHSRLLRQTADEDTELAEVLSAMLILSGRMEAWGGHSAAAQLSNSRGSAREAAGNVIGSFLRKALELA